LKQRKEDVRKFTEEEKEDMIFKHVYEDWSIASLQHKYYASYGEINKALSFNLDRISKDKDFKTYIENRRYIVLIERLEKRIDSYVSYLLSEEGQLEITAKQYKKIADEISKIQKMINKHKAKSVI